MILKLNHANLSIFRATRTMVIETYKVVKTFPEYENYGMVRQIRRAALSVHLNMSEGCSRKSLSERKRFFEVARGSLVEVDTCFDMANELNYCNILPESALGKIILDCFKQISAMIGKRGNDDEDNNRK